MSPMSDLSTPLAQQIAAITAAIRTEADHHANQAGLVASLHALIFAALSRLFTRLESILTLWQAGQLPHPAQSPHPRPALEPSESPRATTPITPAPRRPSRARAAPNPPASPPGASPMRANTAATTNARRSQPAPAHSPAANCPAPPSRRLTMIGRFVQKLAHPCSTQTHAHNITISKQILPNQPLPSPQTATR